MSDNFLLVPIKLDALYVETGRSVMDAMADFRRLPWSNGKEDFNSDMPNLGEAVLAKPFQNKNFTLAGGVHLHWTLPRTLRTSRPGEVAFPAAPNRWLITRTFQNQTRQWIVESDYLNSAMGPENMNMGAITVPVKDKKTKQPYMYMGRQLSYQDWLNEQNNGNVHNEYWKDAQGKSLLTALGYGELSFSTFYPNCRSVFGFFDPELKNTLGSDDATYELLGWYSDSADDVLGKTVTQLGNLINNPQGNSVLLDKLFNDKDGCPIWLSDLMNSQAAKSGWPTGAPTEPSDFQQLRDQIRHQHPTWLKSILDLQPQSKSAFIQFGIQQLLNWKVNGSQNSNNNPTVSIYYGTIDINSTSNANSTPPSLDQVAVGYTGTEALSAYLGEKLQPEEKSKIEDQLEAILFGSRVQNNQVDVGPNFEEARHHKGFIGEDAGMIWTIRKMKLTGPDIDNDQFSGEATLPDTLAPLLNQLNGAQQAYDEALDELNSKYFQLYSDWCKYMMSCYPPLGDKENFPDVDEIRRFIQHNIQYDVQPFKDQIGRLTLSHNQQGGITLTADGTTTTAGQVVSAYNQVKDQLSALKDSLQHLGYEWQLGYVPAPRYYAPRDPVVLFAGDADNCPQLQCPGDELLNCFWDDSLTTRDSGVPVDSAAIGTIISTQQRTEYFQSSVGTWTPQVLEWLVELFPVSSESNLGSASGAYSSTFVHDNFELNEDKFDFTQQDGLVQDAAEYSGRTYVSTSAAERFKSALKDFILKKHPDWDVDSRNPSDFPSPKYSNPYFTALSAYQLLNKKFILTQSLGGFHKALLQHTHNVQIPVADPLGFSDYQTFANEVARVLQGVFTAAPDPSALFIPIRSGGLRLVELELTDHFGIGNKARVDTAITTESLKIPNKPGWSWLGARLSQPARLNFRWLSASSDEVEMNSHPASSPICGWILANYLDHSIVCYDNSGRGLGSFDQSGSWQPMPGAANPVVGSDLVPDNPAHLNPYLLNVLLYLKSRVSADSKFVKNFITALQGAQENIYPENYAGHDALSILMGKPIAIVRASINLEAKGSIAYDQGWNALRVAMQTSERRTDHYQHVEFPVRLGEYRQLDDGLIGYWVEDDGQFQNNTFYINDSIAASYNSANWNSLSGNTWIMNQKSAIETFLQEFKGIVKRQDFVLGMADGGSIFDTLVHATVLKTNTSADASIHYYAHAGLITQSLAAAPTNVTMLVDPHGIVHATTGILPVKTIQIPADQYVQALRHIEVDFFTAPIITPTERLQFSLPHEQDHVWFWLQKQKPIDKKLFSTIWNSYVETLGQSPDLPGDSPWDELVEKNWIKLVNNSQTLFQIVPEDDKNRKPLQTWKDYTKKIQTIINETAWSQIPDITTIDHQAFSSGWNAYVNTLSPSPSLPGDTPWDELVRKGWLQSINSSSTLFQVIPEGDENRQALQTWKNYTEEIQTIINENISGIVPYKPDARFYGQQKILEGWLKLKQIETC